MRRLAVILMLSLSTAAFGQASKLLPTSATVPIDKVAERQNKVDVAVNNAVDALYDDISRQQIFGRVTVGDLMFRTDSADALKATLRNADQIGGPRWIDDQTVQVRLAVEGPAVATALIQIATDAKDKSPIKPDELAPLIVNWGKRTFTAVGISGQPLAKQQMAIRPEMAHTTTQPVSLPLNPPKWASQVIQADGHAAGGATQLLSARAAEVQAINALRTQIEALKVPSGTVGEVAKADPQIAAAIDRALQKAKLTKVDYLANGGANVRASLDLAALWREIDEARQSTIPVFAPR